MSLPEYHGPRVRVGLGKYRVLRVTKALVGFDIHVELGGRVMTFHVPSQVDIHEGDLISLYTEAPLVQPS